MKYVVNAQAFQSLDTYTDNFQLIAHVHSILQFQGECVPEHPLLSLIIPTYCRTGLLSMALDCVHRQTDPGIPWEVLVIENPSGSLHESSPVEEIVQSHQLGNIRYYRNERNVDAGYNWNRGVELARGEWVVFLHDDDLLCDDALYELVRILRHPPKCRKPLGYVHARRVSFSDHFSTEQAHKSDQHHFMEFTRLGALVYGYTRTGMPSCGTAIRRDVYLQSGGINYDFGASADAVLGYQIMKHYAVISTDKILGGYRWGSNETMKPETVRALLESDYYFAQYRYHLNRLGRLWECCFGRVLQEDNLRSKLERLGVQNENKDSFFKDTVPYQKPSRIAWLAYRIVRELYHIAVYAKALWISR